MVFSFAEWQCERFQVIQAGKVCQTEEELEMALLLESPNCPEGMIRKSEPESPDFLNQVVKSLPFGPDIQELAVLTK